jgi:hypothetical protein
MGYGHELVGFFIEARDRQTLQGILQFIVGHQPSQAIGAEHEDVAG